MKDKKQPASPFGQMTTPPPGEDILTGMQFEFGVRTVVETCTRRYLRVMIYHRMELYYTCRVPVPHGTDKDKAIAHAKGFCETFYHHHLRDFNVEDKQETMFGAEEAVPA